MSKFTFDCGCSFEITDKNIKANDGLPSLFVDFQNINMECPLAWDIFAIGRTKGVFQLENKLGQDWSAKIKPVDLDELSAVISVIRPGTLKSKLDGKSLTQHFADRKAKIDTVSYIHPSLEPILSKTYGILVYQEQAMKIATDLAGFSLQEADTLRKAIGKKNAELMTKVEKDFLEKSKTYGVIDEDNANTIFSWIRESQKYSFNKSHGVAYGKVGYLCAYMKAHFPIHFFTSSLFYAKDKQYPQEEIELLIEDALLSGINICPPTLKYNDTADISHFYFSDKNIYFGISDIKSIGDSVSNKIKEKLKSTEEELGKKVKDWTWYEFLVHFCDNITSTAIVNMIDVGTVDFLDIGTSRARKIFEYNIYRDLNSKEKSYIKYIGASNLGDALLLLTNDSRLKITKQRIEKLKELKNSYDNAPYSTEDSMYTIIVSEEKLLGVPLSCNRTDTCLHKGDSMCVDLPFKRNRQKVSVACEISSVREHIIKNGNAKGRKMAFIKVKDSSGTFDGVCIFADEFENYQNLLYKTNTVLLSGEISEKKDSKSLIVKEVKQI